MSTALIQGVLAVIFGVIAVCTFLLKGRQYPTAISACLFGMFFAATDWGQGITAWFRTFALGLFQAAS